MSCRSYIQGISVFIELGMRKKDLVAELLIQGFDLYACEYADTRKRISF